MGQYDDIINLPHHVSAKHPHMSRIDRAAQFSPFQALAGYGAAIHETARLTDQKIDLSEDMRSKIDRQVSLLQDETDSHPEISVIHFEPDTKKAGGFYVTTSGTIKRIDDFSHEIIFEDGRSVSIEDILEIQSEVFGDSFDNVPL